MHQLPSKCCQITGSPFSRQDNNAFGSFFETIKPRMNNELWQDRGLSQAAQLVFHAQVKQVKIAYVLATQDAQMTIFCLL